MRHIKEEEFRTFLQCAKRYQEGDLHQARFNLRVARRTIESLFVKSIRNELKDPGRALQGALLRSLTVCNREEGLLEPQLEESHRQCTLWISEFLEYLPFSRYVPVAGPFPSVVQVGKMALQLEFSGILKMRENKTLHLVTFTPRADRHFLLNDPPTYLKIKLMDPITRSKYGSGNTKTRIHIFSMDKHNKIYYQGYDNRRVSNEPMKHLKAAGSLLVNGYAMPTLPCPQKTCKLYRRCNVLKD